MGFWSKLGKGLAIGGAAAAAPFTGGGSLAAIAPILTAGGEILSNVGQTASGAAKGSMDSRIAENYARAGHDRNALERAALLEQMAMDRAKFGVESPMARTKQAAYGDALSNVQDVNIDFKAKTGDLPQFNVSGGLRPSMFGANARAAGDDLSRQALLALMTGSDTPAATAVPELTPYDESGGFEKTLGGIGLGGSILGGIGEVLKKRQPPLLTSRQVNMPVMQAPRA